MASSTSSEFCFLPKKETSGRAEAREPTWGSAIGATAKIHHVNGPKMEFVVASRIKNQNKKDCRQMDANVVVVVVSKAHNVGIAATNLLDFSAGTFATQTTE
jgi:hypothetical protein